jgi:uncharacterized protein YfaP (DUF2135 family)
VTNDPAHAAAFEALLIAEGSDWWWWYDHRHQAPNKYDFDVLFRYYIRTVYLVTGAEPPIDLDRSLYEQVQRTDDSATYVIPVTYPMSTMHRSNVAARDITVDRTETATRVTLSLARPLGADEELAFTVNGMSAPERVDSGTLRHTLPPGTKSISVVVEEHASHGSPLVFQREHI